MKCKTVFGYIQPQKPWWLSILGTPQNYIIYDRVKMNTENPHNQPATYTAVNTKAEH